MSLFAKFWKRFRTLRSRQPRAAAFRRRRLFAEPLEARQLLAADLHIEKTSNIFPGNSVLAGSTIDYTVTLTNIGTDPATNVTISDMLPDHTVFRQFSNAPTTDEDGDPIPPPETDNGQITIMIPAVDPNGPSDSYYTFTFTLQVLPNAVVDGVTNVLNTVTVTSDNTDEAGNGTDADNQSTVFVPVAAQADVQVNGKSIVGNVTSINVGDDIQFKVTVDNGGPSDSQNVLVSDTLPAGLILKSVDSIVNGDTPTPQPSTKWTFDSSLLGGNKVQFRAADFPSPVTPASEPESHIVFTFTATAVQGTGQPITNTATINPDPTQGQTTPEGPGNDVNNSFTSSSFTVIPPALPDLIVTKQASAGNIGATVVAGTDLTYTITVKNQGSTNADNVKLVDAAPAGTVLVDPSTDFVVMSDTGTNDWIFNNSDTFTKSSPLVPGETATFSMKVHVPASTTSGTNIDNTATASTTSQENDVGPDSATVTYFAIRQAGLTLTKTDAVPPTGTNPTSAIPGQSITYTITVANPTGPSDVTAASLADDLSSLPLSNVSFTSVASGNATGNTASGSSSTINDTINLPVGGKIVYTVTGTISPSATGSLSNTVTVGVPSGTTNTGTASATDTDTLNPTADLNVTKTTTDTSVVGGTGNITYNITVTNLGSSDAVNADLKDDVPGGTTFVSFEQTGGSQTWTQAQQPNPGDTGTIEYTLPTLPPNGTATFTMIVATAAAISNTTVVNTVLVKTDTPEPQPDPHPDSATATSTVTPPLSPDLTVSKTVPTTVVAGSATNLTYTIHVSNIGSAPADTITVTDPMPVVSSGTPPTYVTAGQVTGWTITTQPSGSTGTLTIVSNPGTSLAAGTSQDFTFTIKVPADASNSATITNGGTGNELTVSTTNPEPNTTNNTATPTVTTIQSVADLSVTKSTTNQSVGVGQNIVYTITVGTNGPSNASTVVLSDTIPTGTTYVSMTTADNTWTIEAPNASHPGVAVARKATLAPTSSPTSFTLTVKTNSNLSGNAVITNTATVSSATTDNVPANNNSGPVTTVVLVPFDFGDAPASYEFNTSNISDPARHSISSSLHLGALVDTETANQPNPPGLGDDLNGLDDEDGVVLPGALLINRGAVVTVTVNGAPATGAKLDAWIDFNHNGKFDTDPNLHEQIATSNLVFNGPNTISFAVPSTAIAGGTFARFRLSSAGGLGPTGLAADGEVEDYGVTIATVSPAGTVQVIPNPENPGQNMLSITGTANADTITVNQLRTPKLQVQVVFNGHVSSPINIATFRSIVVYAGAGNDTVRINVAMPAQIHGEAGADHLYGGGGYDEIYGDDGNDYLSGGSGNDILIGGAGNDTLLGGAGRDVLIGGTGVDSLSDSSGDNILIGGSTDLDANHAALQAVMATWGNTIDSFQTRVTKLGALINPGTVHDDAARDTLNGGYRHTGHDWYLDYLAKDLIQNFISSKDKKN